MKRIIYSSKATNPVDSDELVAILESCRSRNQAAGLTGMLLYSRGSFLQMLEADDVVKLEATYSAIGADPRHGSIKLLKYTDVEERMFPDWTMGFENVDDETLAEHLDGFTPALDYPLVDPALISNGGVAETLIGLYSKNRVR